MIDCGCKAYHETRQVVLTGGPGAGKTAVLELASQYLCKHVHIAPESASMLYKGGFPREQDRPKVLKPAQRAIFYVQRELERAVRGAYDNLAVVLCDRGTLDGLAYWPGAEEEFWRDVNSSYEEQLERYYAVIHLHTPGEHNGYNHANPFRIESPQDAATIDKRIMHIWRQHPRRVVIESRTTFLQKAQEALHAIAHYLPECCRSSLHTRATNQERSPAL